MLAKRPRWFRTVSFSAHLGTPTLFRRQYLTLHLRDDSRFAHKVEGACFGNASGHYTLAPQVPSINGMTIVMGADGDIDAAPSRTATGTKIWFQQMWRLVSADADNSGRCAIIEVNDTVVEMSFPRARKTQQIVPPGLSGSVLHCYEREAG